MQEKRGSKKTCAINLVKFCYFIIFTCFEVVNLFENLFDGNDATAAGH